VRAAGARDFVLECIVLLLLARSDAGPQQFGVHIGGAALLLAWKLVRSGR
jgi:hypothetical protein